MTEAWIRLVAVARAYETLRRETSSRMTDLRRTRAFRFLVDCAKEYQRIEAEALLMLSPSERSIPAIVKRAREEA